MVSRRCTASKSTVYTNHGAAMPSAAANNWLVITPSHPRLVNPSSQDGRAVASTAVVVSLWICGRRAHTAQKGLPAPAAHNSGSTTTIKLSINELYPLKFKKRPKRNPHRNLSAPLCKRPAGHSIRFQVFQPVFNHIPNADDAHKLPL